MPWLILALLGGTAFLYGAATENALLCLFTKPLPVVALLLWLRGAPAGAYRRWIAVGLLLSLLGDLLLAWPGDLFVFGLGAFLVAHLAYLTAYLGDTRRLAMPFLLLAALTGTAIFATLASHGLGNLALPVAFYSLTISAMLWRALARLGVPFVGRDSAWLAIGGAALFVLSDTLIGVNRFVHPFAAAPYAIILTYWLGQWGIAASVFGRRTD